MQTTIPSNLLPYETTSAVNQYLLFHYGSAEDQLPYSFGPQESLNFPVRCVQEALKDLKLPSSNNALDIGCATGRASFELARYFKHVTAVDNSLQFIEAAKKLQNSQELIYQVQQEGERYSTHRANAPSEIDVDRVNFQCIDAIDLFKKGEVFDFVLAANLICRLKNPQSFLESLHLLVKPQGVLALASPYSWLEDFTPPHHWLGNESFSSFSHIQQILTPRFTLLKTLDLPFLIREHARKYQWVVSQLSLWKIS